MKFTFATLFLSALIFNVGTNAEGGVIQEEDANADTSAQDAHLPQHRTTEPSPYDLAWQALHVAAAAACRGSTPTGGSGTKVNAVLTRNSRGPESCKQLCANTKWATICDAEVSVYGKLGKATINGQTVNFSCFLFMLSSSRFC